MCVCVCVCVCLSVEGRSDPTASVEELKTFIWDLPRPLRTAYSLTPRGGSILNGGQVHCSGLLSGVGVDLGSRYRACDVVHPNSGWILACLCLCSPCMSPQFSPSLLGQFLHQ